MLPKFIFTNKKTNQPPYFSPLSKSLTSPSSSLILHSVCHPSSYNFHVHNSDEQCCCSTLLHLPALQQTTDGEETTTLRVGAKSPTGTTKKENAEQNIEKNEMLVTSWQKLKSFQLFNTITRET